MTELKTFNETIRTFLDGRYDKENKSAHAGAIVSEFISIGTTTIGI